MAIIRKRKIRERIQAVAAEVTEAIHETGETEQRKRLKNDELFVVDTCGAKSSRYSTIKPIVKDPILYSKKRDGKLKAQKEAHLVEKYKKKLQSTKTTVQKSASVKEIPIVVAPSDPWNSTSDEKPVDPEDFVEESTKIGLPKIVTNCSKSTKHHVKAVEPAQDGQSYLPEFTSHQNVLAQAVSRETEIQTLKNLVLSKGLSDFTKAFIDDRASDDCESDEESEEEDCEIADNGNTTNERANKGKLTRAQRNKMSRHKLRGLHTTQEKKEKKLMKQINITTELSNLLDKEAKAAELKKELKEKKKEEMLFMDPKVNVGGKMIVQKLDVPVNLSDELPENLRRVKPAGNLLEDRYQSLHKRNKFSAGTKRNPKSAKYRIVKT